MDYKEKVIALLNSQELSKEQKEKLEEIFPELKESEDDRIKKVLIDYFKWYKEYGIKTFYDIPSDDVLAWVEKQGEQKPAEWSEEDERMFNSALWHVKNSCGNQGKNSGEFEVYNWLKSIKDRCLPQPKAEWKPSDLPHWKKSNLPNDTTTGFNSDYFCHKGYCINYKELFEKLPKEK